MRNVLTFVLLLSTGLASAANAPDGQPMEEEFHTCINLDCGSAVSSKFHTNEQSLAGRTVYGETFYVEQGRSAIHKTMFPPTRIKLVYHPTTGEIFKPMKDYIPTKEGIKITPESAIKRAPNGFAAQITADESKLYGVRVTTAFQDFQYAITYEKKETYLPKTYGNLGAIQKNIGSAPLSITFFGDSITEGANATSIYAAPHQPGYAGLVMAYLNSKYPMMFESRNNSVGGWNSMNAVSAVEYRVNDKKSDLIILAFGMNDGAILSADKYKKNMQSVITSIRAKQPQTAILLVSPTRANPETFIQNRTNISGYSKALADLANNNRYVAVADVTPAWDMMMQNKKYLDVTGNGLNHPNDFGHRIIAEVVLKAILGSKY